MSNAQQQRAQPPARTELVPIETATQAIALVPQSLDGAMHLARWLATSSFLPDALRGKEGDIFAIVLAGAELGLPPMAALRGMYVVNGRTAMEAKTKAAICVQRGAALYFRRTEYTEKATTWETLRRGESDPRSSRYTRAEAEAAGLTKKSGPWQQYTQRMISHRALGWLCDDAYPDVVLGVATAEDFETDDQITFQPITALGGGVELGTVQARAAAPTPAAQGAPPPSSTPPPVPPAGPQQKAITEDEAVELMTELGKADSIAALKAVGKRIPYATMDERERARWVKAYEDQQLLIQQAAAAEKDGPR